MVKASIGRRGQLTIPAKLRQRYNIKLCTKVRFIERRNEILFKPVIKEYIWYTCGMLKSDTTERMSCLKSGQKMRHGSRKRATNESLVSYFPGALARQKRP